MNALLESLTKSLTEQGWKVEMQENNQIPAEIAQRYAQTKSTGGNEYADNRMAEQI